MEFIKDLEKIIYNNLNDDIKTFYYVSKGVEFPYCVINIDNIKEENNFNYSTYNIKIKIEIFDKNKSNLNLIDISNCVKNSILNLSNIKFNNFNILDIDFIENDLKLLNNIDDVWLLKILFNFIIIKNGN